MTHRVACVDVPALPLQLVLRGRARLDPGGRAGGDSPPLAVVEEDHPQAKILMVDTKAAAARVRPGMRYNVALTVCRELVAAPVPDRELAAAKEELLRAPLARTPRVEPDDAIDGVFWLDPAGMTALFGPLDRWADYVHGALTALGYVGAVVVGFGRLPSLAIARVSRGAVVLASPADEARRAERVPLWRVDVDPELVRALEQLGVRTLGRFLDLPRGEIGVRFGPDAALVHARLADAFRVPMQPAAHPDPIVIEAELDPATDDAARTLFCIKGALHALMGELARRSMALSALELRLSYERGGERREHLEPARASRDEAALLELVRLRLFAIALEDRVERVVLDALPARLDGAQLALFAGRGRDPTAAARGLARLRAAYGDDAVVRARLADGWLPENAFRFEPTSKLSDPKPTPNTEGVLVRRVLAKPERLASDATGRPRTQPPLRALAGPYRLQGGWWVKEAARDYFFGERDDGSLLWLFFDRTRRAWFVHGRLE
ncbi:MAG: DNA polymerase Y family protein [Sandaracinaceae bacterium]